MIRFAIMLRVGSGAGDATDGPPDVGDAERDAERDADHGETRAAGDPGGHAALPDAPVWRGAQGRRDAGGGPAREGGAHS